MTTTTIMAADPAPAEPPHRDDPHWRASLVDVVAALRVSREVTHNIRHNGELRHLPSVEGLGRIVDGLAAALFPTHYGRGDLDDDTIDYYVGNRLAEVLGQLTEQVRRDLLLAGTSADTGGPDLGTRAAGIVRRFALQLPGIRALLVSDLMAAFAGDPAASSYAEILLGYPGMTAILYHRIAAALHRAGLSLLPRLIGHIAHSKTSIDIHPGAEIGRSFFIDHGTGVVIGETTVIGDRVRLYQAVTLGARSFEQDADGMLVKGAKRHPVVEDDVVIYAGATVLGRITIGRGSVIGGNVWLTASVPPGSSITQAKSRAEPR